MDNKTIHYKVIGLMSGTSLDGLDVCYANFGYHKGWVYTIEKATTYPYPLEIRQLLANIQNFNAFNFVAGSKRYGQYMGQMVNQFIANFKTKPDFIASHGHTVFHQPERGITCQIGDGAAIAAEIRLPVICDFRNLDVALGGQGAPLVPIGDRLLFDNYNYCLNIGGFANISFEFNGQRIAYDICPVNIVLNHYAQQTGADYDEDGKIAAKGTINALLLDKLNALDFYAANPPKSLGREWVEQNILPLIESFNISVEDKLCTYCEHAAVQIANNTKSGNVLITGGGAFNTYLIERIRRYSACQITIPDKTTINFKEALIFAFLGVLYMERQPNCLASVTGASYDNIGGAMYNPQLAHI